jgi:hypothetical protein
MQVRWQEMLRIRLVDSWKDLKICLAESNYIIIFWIFPYGSDVVESGTDKYMRNNQTAPYIIGTYDRVS